jgi:hypothetical protein
LLLAWIVQIFGTSALVALFHLSETTVPAIWAVADDVAPFARISFIMFLALLITPLRQRALALPAQVAWWTIASLGATLIVLALLPLHLSRGFGVGLTGSRFDPDLLPIYMSGAAVAGCAGAILHWRCRLTETAAH